jgi:murein DD-endopeptidase MepM/ murein hydrolase activator NlpD
MKRIGAGGAFVVLLLVLLLLVLPTRLPLLMEAPPVSAAVAAPLKVLRGTIEPNTTLARALQSAVPAPDLHRLVVQARPVYDLARVSVGHTWGLAFAPDGVLAAFTYGIDELRTLRVTRKGERFEAEVVSRSYDARVETAAGVIASSLFAAVTDGGESDQLALDLAEIFAWDVDFNTEIQRGDSFRVAVEKLYLDGGLVRYGRILAAEFARGRRVLQAVRFESRAGGGYYAPDGTPLRKAFLRSPLKFSRISSGFTMRRFHPILNRVTPHLGIDYAAPTGTPVLASADGVVSHAGWLGGYGNTVKLRHANGFETLYGHLSRIQVRFGQRVSQGTSVGAVGRTGLATGPHLDYRMIRNGAFVNPLRVQTPPAEPIPADEREAFASARQERLALLPAAKPAAAQVARSAVPAQAELPLAAGGASP